MTNQEAIQSLQETVLIIRLHISKFNPWGYDREAAKEVAAKEGSKTEDTHVTKRKISREAIQGVIDIMSKAYAYHVSVTMPSGTEGDRLVTTQLYETYCTKMEAFKVELNKALDDFVAKYPSWIEEAQTRLKGLFDEKDYPAASEIRDRFSMTWNFLPLPSASCIPSLMGGQIAKIRANVEDEMKKISETAMKSLWERMHTAVSKMAERLGSEKNIFRDSLIDNMRDLCEVLKSLNFNNDSELEAMRKRIEVRLAGNDPDDIRKIRTLRLDLAKECNEIVEEISTKRKLRLE